MDSNNDCQVQLSNLFWKKNKIILQVNILYEQMVNAKVIEYKTATMDDTISIYTNIIAIVLLVYIILKRMCQMTIK